MRQVLVNPDTADLIKKVGSGVAVIFTSDDDRETIVRAADAGLVRLVPRPSTAGPILFEPRGWSDEGCGIELTPRGQELLRELNQPAAA